MITLVQSTKNLLQVRYCPYYHLFIPLGKCYIPNLIKLSVDIIYIGWSLDFSEGDENFNKIDKCSKGTFGCKVDQLMKTENKCRSHYSWISCLHEQKADSL